MTTFAQPISFSSAQKVAFVHLPNKLSAIVSAEIPSLAGITSNHYSVAGGNIGEIVTLAKTLITGNLKLLTTATKLLASLSGSSNNLQPNVPGGNVGEIVTLSASPIHNLIFKTLNVFISNLMPVLHLGTKVGSVIVYLCTGETLLATATKASVLHPSNSTTTTASIVKLARQIFWTRTPLIGEIVSLVYSDAKAIFISSRELLMLTKLASKATFALTNGELLTLTRQATKSFLTKIGEILTMSTVSAHTNFKTLSMSTANVLTGTRLYVKNIYLFQGELLLLPRAMTKTILVALSNLLTSREGQRTFLVNISLLTRQVLALLRPRIPIRRFPIKIIPLNFDYQLPFSYTQAPTNPIYLNDAATVFLTPSEPVGASQSIAMRITAPDKSAVVRYYPFVWINQIPSWSGKGDSQNLTTFAVTQFDPGELNQVGFWQVTLIYNGISVQTGSFYVGPAP